MNESNLKKLKKLYKSLRKLENIYCGDGWYNVVSELCEAAEEVAPRIEFVEVKEKFGHLVAVPKEGSYPPVLKQVIYDLLESFAKLSTTVCEETGGMGKLRINDKKCLKTLCDSSAILLGYEKLH